MLGRSLPQGALPLAAQLAGRGIATSSAAGNVGLMAVANPLTSFLVGGERTRVPMNQPLFADDTSTAALVPPPAFSHELLLHGARVGAMTSASPLATLSVCVEGGSSSERRLGVSRLLQHVFWKSTMHRSTFSLTRELDKIGAITHCNIGREYMAFSLEFLKPFAPDAAELLMDSVLCPAFKDWEIADLMQHAEAAAAARLRNPLAVVEDLLHKAAYDGPLGKTQLPDPASMSKLRPSDLLEFAGTNITPASMVVAAAGLDAGQVKALVMPLLEDAGARACPLLLSCRAAFARAPGVAARCSLKPLQGSPALPTWGGAALTARGAMPCRLQSDVHVTTPWPALPGRSACAKPTISLAAAAAAACTSSFSLPLLRVCSPRWPGGQIGLCRRLPQHVGANGRRCHLRGRGL